MDIVKVSDLAKSGLNEINYNTFMAHINNRKLNDVRLFIDNQIDELIFSTKLNTVKFRHEKIINLKKLDNIVTNEYINQIDVNGTATVSK